MKRNTYILLGVLFGTILAILIGLYISNYFKEKSIKKVQLEAQKEIEPVIEELSGYIDPDKEYDLEETIRIIHALDLGMQRVDNFRAYLLFMSKQDYSLVASDIIEARIELLNMYNKINIELEEMGISDNERKMIIIKAIASVVLKTIPRLAITAITSGISFGASSILVLEEIRSSRKMVIETISKLKVKNEEKIKLEKEFRLIEDDLIIYLYEYSKIYYKYYAAWDALCVNRDMAYMAIDSDRLDVAQIYLDNVLKINENDKEAMLLKGSCLIERPQMPFDDEYESFNIGLSILEKYIELYPAYAAPALLLKGVLYSNRGDNSSARLFFSQAAAYYPKQSECLNDMFDAYRMRTFLRKSKEGNLILKMYKSMMLGAGYFSPDFHIARLNFEMGDNISGRDKIIDHFQRRRNQGNLAYILADMKSYEKYLRDDFNLLFPENLFIDVDLEGSGNKLNLSLRNNSDKELLNVTIVLCLHFTDMIRGDYEPFRSNTLPSIKPYEKADFGDVKIDFELFGNSKSFNDVVEYRAILISNDVVSWIDTDEYRSRVLIGKRRSYKEQIDISTNSYLERLDITDKQLKDYFISQTDVEIEDNWVGSDYIVFRLPYPLTYLKPLFRLRNQETKELVSPSINKLENDYINLSFKYNIPKEGKSISLEIYSPYRNIKVVWIMGEKGFDIEKIEFNN